MGKSITIIGVGPGSTKYLTREAEEKLLRADKVFFRTAHHPVFHWLREQGRHVAAFDLVYLTPGIKPYQVYDVITAAIIKEAHRSGQVTYALPGHPYVFEQTTRTIGEQARLQEIAVHVIPGLSFLELIYLELGLEPGYGLQITLPGNLEKHAFSQQAGLIIAQIYAAQPGRPHGNLQTVQKHLLTTYPSDHPAIFIWNRDLPSYETFTKTVTIAGLVDSAEEEMFFTTLYIPPLSGTD